jgi:hypothetical protein
MALNIPVVFLWAGIVRVAVLFKFAIDRLTLCAKLAISCVVEWKLIELSSVQWSRGGKQK